MPRADRRRAGLYKEHARLEHANDVPKFKWEFVNSITPETRNHVRENTNRVDALKVINTYPNDQNDVMPTRLGNLLRRYEANAGVGYDINILQKATHLALVAQENHVEYLNDQRSGLDLAVRLCASGIIASMATALLMWPWDIWLLLTAVPYALAYVSYRGALVAATHYGDALAALVDLNRFRMYKELHLRLPDDTSDERTQNALMTAVIAGMPENITYEHPITPSADTPMPS